MAPRLLCARHPHLGLVAAWRRHPELSGEPVVLVQERVVAASAAAQSVGVRPGQAPRTVRQLCPGAVHLAPDDAAITALRAAVLEALTAVVPAVELGDEEAWCDLSGGHALWRDEASWAAAAARALTAALGEHPPAVGVASNRFVAWMAARQGRPRHIRRVPAGGEAAFLAPLPVGLLPADSAILARLGDLGLDRIGQVAALSPLDLQRQFGEAGAAVCRLARGQDDLPLVPTAAPRRAIERVVLDGPVTDREVLHRCARRAAAGLGERLRARGLGSGRLALVLEGETATEVLERLPPLAVGSAEELWPVVFGLLGGCDAALRRTGPVAALRLEAGDLGIAPGRQADLWRRGDAARDAVAQAVMRVCDRFGAATVLRPRLALDPGDLPERRFRWEPGTAAPAAPAPVAAPTLGP